MTEAELRKKVVNTAKKYMGAKEGGKDHKHLMDVFNTVKPDGWAMTYSAPWCAAFASAVEIEALGKDDAKKICPMSANCGTIVTKAKKMGIWIESDKHTPKEADWILYDWQDSGKGDDTGSPDHVGIVEKVSGGEITVIEGNRSDMVARRFIKVDGRYIRGFVAIPYAKIAGDTKTTKKKKVLKVGAKIRIKENANQYGKTKRFAPKVYKTTYKVVEINGNRVVFATTDGKTVMGAVSKGDCILK